MQVNFPQTIIFNIPNSNLKRKIRLNMEEVTKLERLFAQYASLRPLIPKLIENRLYYSQLNLIKEEWKILKDVLEGIGILIGDIIIIHSVLKSAQPNEIEVEVVKGKKKEKEEGSILTLQ